MSEETRRRREPKTILSLARAHPNYVRDVSDFNFIKTIGKGGFGEVWLTQDTRSGKYCAVKEIYSHRLTGRQLRRFLREVDTMAQVRSRFVVPFVGFSVEPPYSIITEYLPNSSLDKFVYRRKTAPLSGTRLTIVAMCIAYGMRNMHELGILHRDLKSPNILMNDRMLPRICDFGIARNLPANCRMSRGCGTPGFMAPELLSGNIYTKAVDVFSYGILLYEMSEGSRPFGELNGPEISKAVVDKGLRPEFSRNTPSSLQKFISSCWDQDPERRPTFSKICEMFSSGQVYFPKCDVKKVQRLAKTVEDDDAVFRQTNHGPSSPSVDIDAVIRRLKESVSGGVRGEGRHASGLSGSESATKDADHDDAAENEAEDAAEDAAENEADEGVDDGADEAEDAHHGGHEVEGVKGVDSEAAAQTIADSFMVDIERCLSAGTFDASEPFVSSGLGVLRSNVSDSSVSKVVSGFLRLITGIAGSCHGLWASGFFEILPLSSPELINLSLECVHEMLVQCGDVLDVRIERLLRRLLLTRPVESVCLFMEYSRQHLSWRDLSIVDIFLDSFMLFCNERVGSEYVRVLYGLLSSSELFLSSRLSACLRILCEFCRSPSARVSECAVRCVLAFNDGSFEIPYDAVLFHLPNPSVGPLFVSLLLRSASLPPSRTLARCLLEHAQSDRRCLYVLLRFCDMSLEHTAIVVRSSGWLRVGLPTLYDTFQLFLCVFRHPEARSEIGQNPDFCEFLRLEACHGDNFVVGSIASILKRVSVDSTLLSRLESSGFIQSFFERVCGIDDPYVQNNAIVVLDILSRVGFSSGYLCFIPHLCQLLRENGDLAAPAITVLLTLSFLRGCHESLRGERVDEYFRALGDVPAYAEYSRVFAANLC